MPDEPSPRSDPASPAESPAASDPASEVTLPVDLVAAEQAARQRGDSTAQPFHSDATMPTIPLDSEGNIAPDAAVKRMRVPDRLGHYDIQGKLGEGGMGLVLEAVQTDLGRPVALKLLKPELARDPEFVERFLREARAGGLVDHPNVVTIYDAGKDGEQLYMACQLVKGRDLGQLLAGKHTLTEHKALRMIVEACKGLQALHEAGLVHRDIKPGNIFTGDDGSVLIGDLGLARLADGDDRMTMTGTAIGTPAYMSPEHIQGVGDLDIRSDVYALGATLYRMVTGQEPFPGDTLFVVTHKILTEELPDPRRLNPSLSPEVAAVIKKAMAKDRDERYAEPRDLQADCERALAGRPLLGAQVDQVPGLKIVGSTEEPRKQTTGVVGPVAGRPTRGGGGGILQSWLAIPSGMRRLLVLGLLFGLLAWGLSQLPNLLEVPDEELVTEPAWASDFATDDHGPVATLPLGGEALRLRYCPPGTFSMGAPVGEHGRKPGEDLHQVTLLRGFWISETEVPQRVYRAVLGARADPSRFRREDQPGADPVPVDSVSWDEAVAFCAAAEQLTPGETGIRLPTESEWEYACRAGSDKAFGLALEGFARGWYANEELTTAYLEEEARPHSDFRRVYRLIREKLGQPDFRPRPVGKGRPNAWGLHDMHGNVAEWVIDEVPAEHSWGNGPVTDPRWSGGELRVLRGGSWSEPETWCRAASRVLEQPDVVDPSIGFRIVIPEPFEEQE